MTATRVTYDVTDPAFPHGEYAGSSRGCDGTVCDDACTRARRRAHKLGNLRRAHGFTRNAKPEVEARMREHLKALRKAVPYASDSAICRAAGLSDDVLATYKSRKSKGIAATTARAFLAVRPLDVVAELKFVPRDQVALKMRQYQALGYPLDWQGKQAGVHAKHVLCRPRTKTGEAGSGVTIAVANALDAVHRRIGDTPADAERDGIPQRGISMAKVVARRNGVYPPAFYDEDGTLDWRAIPDHPWTVAVESAHKHLSRLERIVKNPDAGSRQLAHLERPDLKPMLDRDGFMSMNGNPEFMTLERAYSRILGRLGIRQQDDPALVKERRETYRQVLHRFYRWGEGDPIELLLDLGLMKLGALDLPDDYPVVAKRRKAKKAQQKRNAARKQARYKARLAAKDQTETRELVAA